LTSLIARPLLADRGGLVIERGLFRIGFAARLPETGYFDLEPPFVAVEHAEKVAIALSGPLELHP